VIGPSISTKGMIVVEVLLSSSDVAARIIKLNISRKEETFTFKPKDIKKCNQVMIMIRSERNAMTPDKKPSVVENFSTKFPQRAKNVTLVATRSSVAPTN
jgi:hypothetical protein